MKKRLALAVVAATAAAGVIGGVSSAGVKHDARCAALHAKAAHYQQAANSTTNPNLKVQYQNKANRLELAAEQCDAHSTTSSTP